MTTHQSTIGLNKAVGHFLTKAALARALNVKPMTVTHWFNRGLPARRAKEISEATSGFVSVRELLPEIFDENQA